VFWWVVEQRAYPTLRVVTVPKRGVMETIAPEHGFWNSQTPVTGVSGDDLVSVGFLERFIGLASRGTQWVAPLPAKALANTLCKALLEVQDFSTEILLRN